jgi:hypothetical protein
VVDFGYRTALIRATGMFKDIWFGRIGENLQDSPHSLTASIFSHFSPSL